MEAASAEAMSAYGGAAGAEASQLAGIAEMGGGAAESLAGGADWGVLAQEAQGTLTSDVVAEAVPVREAVAAASPVEAPVEVAQTVAEAQPQGLVGEAPKPITASPTAPSTYNVSSNVPPAASKDYFNNFMEWVKKNKEVAKMGLEGVKGMVGSDLEDAKVDYYKNEANRYRYGNTVARYNPQPLIGARA